MPFLLPNQQHQRTKGTHTHTSLTALCPEVPGWAGTRKVKPIWILLKQETASGIGISWATICNSVSRSRQITMPAPHHSVFYRPDALPAAQPTASKHWRQQCINAEKNIFHAAWLCKYVRKENEVALQWAEMRMVRWMFGIKLIDRFPSKELRERLGIDDIALVLQQNRLRWYGHVLWKEDDDWVKKCVEYEVKGPRPRGRRRCIARGESWGSSWDPQSNPTKNY